MAPPIKRNGTQIASCLRFKDKHGEPYYSNFVPSGIVRNRKERRKSMRGK